MFNVLLKSLLVYIHDIIFSIKLILVSKYFIYDVMMIRSGQSPTTKYLAILVIAALVIGLVIYFVTMQGQGPTTTPEEEDETTPPPQEGGETPGGEEDEQQPPPTGGEVTLIILTRHDTTIQEKTKELFLNSEVAKRYNIVDIKFRPASGPLWESYLSRPGQVDVAWGGGPTLFDSLLQYWDDLNLPEMQDVLSDIPDDIAGVPVKRFGSNNEILWVGAAISSFGFTVNHDVLNQYGLEKPIKWSDLASPDFAEVPEPVVGIADPLRSTSNTRIYEIILQAYGWERGWGILTLIAANARIYDASDAVREAVIAGEIAVGSTIDFYGYVAMSLNPATEYIIPQGESIVNADPIALVKGSNNKDAAVAFIRWVLSEEGQKIWLDERINRMPVNPKVFDTPEGMQRSDLKQLYEMTLNNQGIIFDDERALKTELAMQYFFRATLIDAQAELKQAWKAVVQLRDTNPDKYNQLVQMLTSLLEFTDPETGQTVRFTEDYAISINDRLRDPEFLDTITQVWREAAVNKYLEIYNLAVSG